MAVSTQNPQREEELEKIRKELYRKSLDDIRVYNPTKEDRVVVYAGFNHVVPAEKEHVLPRYIANKYVREYVDEMINRDENEKVEEENKQRAENGNPPISPQERETLALRYGLHHRNKELREKYIKQVYKGIDKEYGLDMVTQSQTQEIQPSEDVDIMSRLDEQPPAPDRKEVKKASSKEVKKKKEELVKKTSDKK